MKPGKLKLKKIDKGFFLTTVALALIGLVVISSASVVLSSQRFGRAGYYVERQVVFVLVGFVIMLVLSRVDYHWFKRYSTALIFLAVVLLIAVLVPGIGFKVGNSRRWINLGIFLLQPSELSKLALICYLAAWFDARRNFVRSFWAGLVPPLLISGLIAGLVIMEPDFGTMSSILLIAFTMFFIGGAQLSHLLYLIVSGAGVGWLAVQAAPYRMERILTFLNPSSDPLGAGYHINQAILAVGSGGLFGLGFGESLQKHNFLPEPIGDSVFAIMSEELGFLRVAMVLLVYVAFVLFGLKIARRAPDDFGRYLTVGVSMWVVVQLVVNVGAIVGILPLTGITLPFMSSGGSSVIALLAGIGIVLNISRQRA